MKLFVQLLFRVSVFLRQPIHSRGFPGSTVGKESACNEEDLGLIPGLGRSLEEGMATHSSILAGESHGQRSLAGPGP